MANSDELLPGLLQAAGYEFEWLAGGRCRMRRGEWAGYFESVADAVVSLLTIANTGTSSMYANPPPPVSEGTVTVNVTGEDPNAKGRFGVRDSFGIFMPLEFVPDTEGSA